jgi:DNA-binding CsgD family transcriptional regulator/tetratricopeptide (TPR) repeat protein
MEVGCGYRLLWDFPAGRARARREAVISVRDMSVRWPLTTRERELASFDAAWAQRSCQGAVIAGPAGVGKSWLAEECLARASRTGFKARQAAASAAAGAVPLGAIAHLVPAGVDLSDPVRGFAEVARVVAGPGRDRRWAVLVDDVHLLDAASAVLLRQLMDTGLVRVIATVRTGEPTGDAVRAVCTGDRVGRIDLDAFDRDQIGPVLEAALGGPVSPSAVHQLFTDSGGNAFYLRELVHSALADGSLAFDGEIWRLTEGRVAGTPRLSELIAARLTGTGPEARAVLDLLALCEPVPLADAEATAGGLQTVTALEAAALITVDQSRRRTLIALAHPLYGETLRAQMNPQRRNDLLLAQIHSTQAHGARRREDALRTTAWQLAATGTADPAQLTQAAAVARYAHDYPQALTLLQAVRPQDHTTFTRMMLGEVLFEIGEPDRAEQVFQTADQQAATEPEVLAVTMARCFNLYWSAARTDAALQVNDQARSHVSSEPGRRVLRYNEGWMRIHAGEPELGLGMLADLEDDIGDAADPVGWLFGSAMKPVGLELVGRTGEAVAAAERSRAAQLEAAALVLHPAASLTVLADALLANGQLARARDAAEQGFAELTAAHIPVPTIWTTVHLGRIELLAGHPASARRWFAEAAALGRRHHSATAIHAALCGLATCAAILGDLQGADQALAEADTHPHLEVVLDLNYQARGWLAAARGNSPEARRLLAEGAAEVSARGMVSREVTLLTDLARLGGAELAADRLAELTQACDGPLAPAGAHLAAALAANDQDRLTDAAREWGTIGADLVAAEAATAAGAAHRASGDTRKATAAAQLARTHLERCEGARTPLVAAAPTTSALTARERDIALLAARGSTSQDIAEKRHLSVRTVENHLQRAYTKLGVTNRTELAQALDTGSPAPST